MMVDDRAGRSENSPSPFSSHVEELEAANDAAEMRSALDRVVETWLPRREHKAPLHEMIRLFFTPDFPDNLAVS